MRRRNRNGARREKVVMILSSVFVLTALTVTGLVIRGKNEEKSDGYVVDFSAIEQGAEELAQNDVGEMNQAAGQNMTGNGMAGDNVVGGAVTEDDLDYDPFFQETNSINVENEEGKEDKKSGGKASGSENGREKDGEKEEGMFDESRDTASNTPEAADTLEEVARMEEMEDTMAIATSTSIQPALTFGDGDTLSWPVVGNVLINYSMDKTVYFPTLQQYKYNPAIVISAVEGETITAAANGKITGVYTDTELGNVVVTELGNGYELTYGQLKDVTVSEGGFVNKGDIIGNVAAPTKYYAVEGCNVYFKLTKDGVPVNPMSKLN